MLCIVRGLSREMPFPDKTVSLSSNHVASQDDHETGGSKHSAADLPGEELGASRRQSYRQPSQLTCRVCLQVQRRPAASSSGLATRRLARPARAPRPLPCAAAAAAAGEAPVLPFRVGHGWDLHRLEPGYPLIIGGIDIPHDRGCVAHSDGAPRPQSVLGIGPIAAGQQPGSHSLASAAGRFAHSIRS